MSLDRRLRQQLAQRLGGHALRQRQALQLKREANWDRGGARGHGRALCWLSGAAGWAFRCTGLYGVAHRAFHRLALSEREVVLDRLPAAFDGLRLLHLSDLHLDLDPHFPDTLIKVVRDCPCDLCVLTGDYRNFTFGDDLVALRELERVLAAVSAPCYGVLGNHDAVESVPAMEALGLRILLNEHVVLRKDGQALCLAGVDDPNIYRTHRLDRALRGIPGDQPVVLLSHSPAIHAEAARAGVDLVLAGHLHGGQIRIPFLGSLIRNDRSPRRFWVGAWRDGPTQGYTSRGTGACGVPLRLRCPPEAVIHVLRCGARGQGPGVRG